jgi:hypothetical protein
MLIIVMALCQYLGVRLGGRHQQAAPDRSQHGGSFVGYGRLEGNDLLQGILPLMGSSFLYSLIFTFMSAMTTISAIIFLVYPGTTLAAVYILQVAEQGAIARAAAMSVVLITIVALSLFILNRTYSPDPPGPALKAAVSTPWGD